MLKKRLISVLAGLALLATIAGTTGIVADAFGLTVTGQAHACSSAGSSGGGC